MQAWFKGDHGKLPGNGHTSISRLQSKQHHVVIAGNVATEDVVYLLDGLGIQHGVKMDHLLKASSYICEALQKPNASHVANAKLAQQS